MPAPSLVDSHVSHGRRIQYREHRILTALPADEFERLAPHLQQTTLTFKRSLYKGNQPIKQVCFPNSGVCSVMLMTHDRVFIDQFKLTHEFLALVLGDSRPQVSVIAKQIEQAGLSSPIGAVR
jgi:hypothetical protein